MFNKVCTVNGEDTLVSDLTGQSLKLRVGKGCGKTIIKSHCPIVSSARLEKPQTDQHLALETGVQDV
jgi:hypothetical protein